MTRTMRMTVLWIGCVLVMAVGCWGSALVISEVAWAGTAASSSDEWIELQNVGESAIDLTGWELVFGDVRVPLGEVGDDAVEVRTTSLAAGGFLLLERTDDRTVSDVAADILYKGSLPNTGILMELRDPQGVAVDSVTPTEDGWPAGTPGGAEPAYCTMERTDSGDWISHNQIQRNGLDADGNPLNGTPGQPNSAAELARVAPAVALSYPGEAVDRLSGTVLIFWEAVDPNGLDSALSIGLFLARDGGEWVPLIENLANTGSYSWDTTAHPSGEEYRILVRTADVEGFSCEAVSPPFEIANTGA